MTDTFPSIAIDLDELRAAGSSSSTSCSAYLSRTTRRVT